MSGYGYVKRDIDKSMIDWSGLTKTISDGLIAESTRRSELKNEIEKDQAEQLRKVSEFEQGQDPKVNAWAMQQAQQARDFLLQQHKLMKGGFMSVDNTKIIKQNVTDGWADFNSALATYNENFKRISELEGKGNEAILKEMGDFANIKNRRLYYDPNTGSPYFADVDQETGEIIKGTLKPVKAFNNVQAQSFETIDVEATTAELSKGFAEYKVAFSPTSDITNVRNNQAYKQQLENVLEASLNSDQKIASVLMDHLNMGYTKDPNAPKKEISYEYVEKYDSLGRPVMGTKKVSVGDVQMEYKNGVLVPSLTEEQRQLAKDAFVTSLENKLAFESAKQYVAPPSLSGKESEAKDVAGLIDQFVRDGSLESLKSALNTSKSGVTGTKLEGKNLVIYQKGQRKTVDLTKSQKDIGVDIAGILGYGTTYNRESRVGNQTPNQRITQQGFGYGNLSETIAGGRMSDSREGLLTAAIAGTGGKPNAQGVNTQIQSALQESGLPSDLIVVEGDKVKYNSSNPIGEKIIKDKGNNSLISNLKDLTPAKLNDVMAEIGQQKSNKQKRTILQIMKEDGVSRTEAIKIFNNQ